MNRKVALTAVTVVALLLAAQYLGLPNWFRELGVETSGWLIMLSIALAIVLSLWLIHRLIHKFPSGNSRAKRIGSYIGGYGLYPIALFLGFVVGGNFGGAIGDNAFGTAGTVLGIGVGVFLVSVIVCSAGASIGFLVGSLTQRFMK